MDNKITIFEITDYNISNNNYIKLLNSNKKIDKYIVYHNKYNYRVIDYLRNITDNYIVINKIEAYQKKENKELSILKEWWGNSSFE